MEKMRKSQAKDSMEQSLMLLPLFMANELFMRAISVAVEQLVFLQFNFSECMS